MSKFTLLLAFAAPALSVGLLLGSPSSATADSGPGGQPVGTVKVEGALVSANLTTGQVTIQTRAGLVTVGVTAATKIERNGRRVVLGAFKIGDRVQATTSSTGIASKIEAVGP